MGNSFQTGNFKLQISSPKFQNHNYLVALSDAEAHAFQMISHELRITEKRINIPVLLQKL